MSTPRDSPDSGLLLREVLDGDLPIFFDQQRNPAAQRMAAFLSRDADDRDAFEAHWARIRHDETMLVRTIERHGVVLGNVGSFVLFDERNVAYGLGAEYWGRGYATAALRLFLALETRRPLHGRAAFDNAGSIRVLEKCGFVHCGRERSFARARNAEIDEVILRLDT